MKTLLNWKWWITCIAILAMYTSSQAEPPKKAVEESKKIFFARSGQRARLPGTTAQLRYMDTRLPYEPQRGGLFQIPSLRAPGPIQAYDDSGRKIADFVVYPKEITGLANTSAKTFLAKTLDPPLWFLQWAEATQLFAERKGSPKSPDRKEDEEEPELRLLILGPDAAGKSPQAVLNLLQRYDLRTALVFNPKWSGPINKKPVDLDLAKAKGELLKDYQALGDPAPLKFPHTLTPCTQVMNRIGWLGSKEELPYVEELFLDSTHRILVSYVPWETLLGRSEQADHLFRHLLVRGTESPLRNKTISDRDNLLQLDWPRRWDIREEERPVVYHRIDTPLPMRGKRVDTIHLVDLRGRPIQQAKQDQLRKSLRERPLLILGTDPILKDMKKQLEAEAKTKTPPVAWLKDDTLPPDAKTAYRIMETLTRLKVALPPRPTE